MKLHRFIPVYLLCSLLGILILPAVVITQERGWERANGPYGGYIHSLAVGSNGDLFAGTAGSDVYRSTDHGESWNHLAKLAEMSSAGIYCLVSSPTGELYACNIADDTTYGVYRSSDHGASWERVVKAFAWSVVCHGDNVIAAAINRIYRSTDRGISWSLVDTLGNGLLAVHPDGSLYNMGGGSPLRSTDEGITWTPVDTAWSYTTTFNVYTFVIAPNGHLFIGSTGGDPQNGVFRSTDRGVTWERAGLPHGYIGRLCVNSQGMLYAGLYDGTGMFRSWDDGLHWEAISSGIANPTINAIAHDSTGGLFCGTADDGVYRSMNDGLSWERKTGGIANTSVLTLLRTSTGTLFAGTVGTGLFRSTNDADSWELLDNGLPVWSYAQKPGGKAAKSGGAPSVEAFSGWGGGEARTLLEHPDGEIFVLEVKSSPRPPDTNEIDRGIGGVYSSSDNGSTWSLCGGAGFMASTLALNPMTGSLFTARSDLGVCRSDDKGCTWLPTSLKNPSIQAIAFDTAGRMYAGGPNAVVFRSSDFGAGWDTVPIRIPGSWKYTVASLVTSPSGSVFAILRNYLNGYDQDLSGLYRSDDHGDTWNRLSGVVPNTGHPSLTADASGILYAGMCGSGSNAGGIYQSTDNGETWTNISADLQTTDVLSILVTADHHLFTGINGEGVFRSVNRIPRFELQAQSVSFDTVAVSTTVSRSVIIRNPGDLPLVVDSIWTQIGDISVSPSSQIIPPRKSGTVTLTADPTGVGPIQGELYFRHNAGPGLDSLAVTGCAALLDGRYQIQNVYYPSTGWQLISTPLRREGTYPMTGAFRYDGRYHETDEITPGPGYWKYLNTPRITFSGLPSADWTGDVGQRWTLIGSVSAPVPSMAIFSMPGGLVCSGFFEYANGYHRSDTIKPGHGYWVKMSGAGQIVLSVNPSREMLATNAIRIIPSTEMPPAPPEEGGTDPVQLPGEYYLAQNWPNPFNPVTSLSFGIREKQFVSVKVYDVLGREAATLMEEWKDAGVYSVRWDASSSVSGVYYCRMTAGLFTQTKKMLLIR